MIRMPTCAVLVLTVLSMRGERLEARYVEGSELVHLLRDSSEMRVEGVTFNGEDLPPESLETMGFSAMSTRDERTLRFRDTIVAATDGRPTRVRRLFEELRKHSVESDGEKDEVGPLEGRSVLLSGDEAVSELEDDGAEVDESYLADHKLVRYADYLLPQESVEVGERWQVDEDSLRRMNDVDASPAYFESELENKAFRDALAEGCTIRGEAEFAEIDERNGMRCAVLAYEVDIESEVDDLSVLGDDMADASGDMRLTFRYRGKLWYALDEGRPVALEMDPQGSFEMRMEVPFGEEDAPPLEFRVKGTITGDFASTWETPE